nr:neprilysin-like [Dermacentor andersoni]
MPDREKSGKVRHGSTTSSTGATKGDDDAKKGKHAHRSDAAHEVTVSKARESLNLLHHGIKPSLHLAKRRGTNETETTSKLYMKTFQHQDEIATGRTFPEHIAQTPRMVTRRVLQVSAACAVLVMSLLLTITAYLFLSSTLWTSLKYCDSRHCADLAKRLADSINTSADPCDDFYSFVCGRTYVTSVLDHANEKATQDQLAELAHDVWHVGRASRLYHKCLEPEPKERAANIRAIKKLLRKLSLRWPKEQPLPGDRHPMDVMLEMAIKWDINFLFGLQAIDSHVTGKVLVFRKARPTAAWVDRIENPLSLAEYARHVEHHLKIIEASSKVNHAILMQLERSFTEAILNTSREQSWLTLSKFDSKTASLGKGILVKYIRLHYNKDQLNHSWASDDWAVLEDANALTNIDKLFEKHTREHLLIGIAWLFIQSHLWAVAGEPELMFRNDIDEKKKHACLEYVNSRLGLLTSAKHLTQLFPTSESRQEVSDFLLSLKSELKSLAENARWIDLETREMAKRKIDRVALNVLPAEQFFAPLQRALLYEAFPSMNDSVFFESWLKVSSTYQALQSHKHFRDVYSKRRVFGQEPLSYNYLLSVVDAAMVALEPPRYYVGAPVVINYAGAGTLFALEISKSFDELGTTVDSRGETVRWWGRAQSTDYDRRLSCDLGKHVTIPLIPTIPALEASYSAYKTAVSREADARGVRREVGLRGLDTYSEEEIFFMTYCYALCGGKGSTRSQEKCNVPLRHSSKFAEAFRCPEGSKMNALKKCTFFS